VILSGTEPGENRSLAHFWDTHDPTDFEDQLDEVNEPVFQRETVLKIHLGHLPVKF
jgi:hypothetical protein